MSGIRNGVSNTTPAGIARLHADLAAGRNLILMCMEHAPGDCHRQRGGAPDPVQEQLIAEVFAEDAAGGQAGVINHAGGLQ